MTIIANWKIIVQSENIRGNKADSVASLKFIILNVTRYTNLKTTIQCVSIRGNEENAGASLKFIILGVTKTANQNHYP